MSMRAEEPTSGFLSMAETCRRLRLSRWTVRKLIRDGEIQAVKGPARNAPIRVYATSVADYLTRNTISPPAPLAEGAA
jgi:excisionase family DNA binding protein